MEFHDFLDSKLKKKHKDKKSSKSAAAHNSCVQLEHFFSSIDDAYRSNFNLLRFVSYFFLHCLRMTMF